MKRNAELGGGVKNIYRFNFWAPPGENAAKHGAVLGKFPAVKPICALC